MRKWIINYNDANGTGWKRLVVADSVYGARKKALEDSSVAEITNIRSDEERIVRWRKSSI